MSANQNNLDNQIDAILEALNDGKIDHNTVILEASQQQPAIHDFLFLEEHGFLTENERDQLIFMFVILWELRSVDRSIESQEIEDLEEAFWKESEDSNFIYSSENSELDRIPDEVIGVLLDCCEVDDHNLTTSGAVWLLIKGLVLASLLLE